MQPWKFVLAGFVLLACVATAASPLRAAQRPAAVTVPMRLELDRPYIDVSLTGPGGGTVRAHAWVDTGGGAIMLSAGLARRLGVKPTGKPMREEGHALVSVDAPALRIGNMPLTLVKPRAVVVTDEPHGLDRTDAEMALPGSMLRNYVVTFDYPAQTFSVARPEGAHPAGRPVRSFIGSAGMPVVWLDVAGQSQGFLLDTGGQVCMISRPRLDDWIKSAPTWKHVTGAYGPANMLFAGDRAALMLRIGELRWGPFALRDAAAVSRPAGTYERWMSGMLERPVIGSIGGNVLRDFRVTIDYPAGKVYLLRQPLSSKPALPAMVGITLVAAPRGGYAIAGTAAHVQGIRPGDRLLRIDGRDVRGVSYDRVVEWLGGAPGQTPVLGLSRAGQRLTVMASVRSVF